MNPTDLKTTLSTATDEELIRMAGEMLGREMRWHERQKVWSYWRDQKLYMWEPLESESDAFELVDFIHKSIGLFFRLEFTVGKWQAQYLTTWTYAVFMREDSRCHAIVKASIKAWEGWRGMEK